MSSTDNGVLVFIGEGFETCGERTFCEMKASAFVLLSNAPVAKGDNFGITVNFCLKKSKDRMIKNGIVTLANGPGFGLREGPKF
jgi:hypothetical protein